MSISRLKLIYFVSISLLLSCDYAGQKSKPDKTYSDYSPSWSSDGGKIAYASDRTGNNQIFAINPDGSGEQRVTSTKSNDWHPSWSPDGTKIAFCSDRDGNDEIYVMNADGSNATNLTNHPASDCEAPAWSHDGKKLAFISNRTGDWRNNKEDNWEIFVMNADGTNQVRLTYTRGFDLLTEQAWSPDDKQIVFCTTNEKVYDNNYKFRYDNFDLYTMNADGSKMKQLTFTPGQDSYPYWSPDGKKIAYTHVDELDTPQNYEVYVINQDGTGRQRLTNTPEAFEFETSWSPDSKQIAYASSEQNPMAIYIMDADGKNKRRLTNHFSK